MKIVLFGATGMVGQGVLRECLLDPGVEAVLCIGRGATGQTHAKLREVVTRNLADLLGIESDLPGYQACFFCLGVSSAGMPEAAYRKITYTLTMAIARTLAEVNPGMTFIYVSGAGTDGTGRSRFMWARVKGETENDLLRLPFRAVYMFRPGFIQPLHGIRSKTAVYRTLYAVLSPVAPLLTALLPQYATTTERLGRAMIRVASQGAPKPVLESRDINQLAG